MTPTEHTRWALFAMTWGAIAWIHLWVTRYSVPIYAAESIVETTNYLRDAKANLEWQEERDRVDELAQRAKARIAAIRREMQS